MKRFFFILLTFFMAASLWCKEIIVGIEPIPEPKLAVLFTPVVLLDLISAKMAFEYRIHRKFSLVIPLEAKWMDYRWAINLFSGQKNVLKDMYDKKNAIRLGWNLDFSQFKISTGIGAKWFPFSESMQSGLFIKSSMLAGMELFNAHAAEGKKQDVVFTHVATIGYTWVKRSGFTIGFELGEEYTWHTDPIKKLPILIQGFMPVLQMNLGFTI